MRALSSCRLGFAAACLLLAARAGAADITYVQLAGIPGPPGAGRYGGWFKVDQDSIVLAPGVSDAQKKRTVSTCTATLRTRLGAAGATVAQLIGSIVGDVKLERVAAPDRKAYFQAVLRNAVLTQQATGFDFGVPYDTLWLRFEAIDVTTYETKADGTRVNGTESTFNCGAAQ